MTARECLRSVSRIVSQLSMRRPSRASTGCSDCPIVMRCGLEPEQQCLGRIEAIARCGRRQPGTWDTGITLLIP
jgi:hypothetical protein